MPSYDRALWALRKWLDSWPGIGHVGVGMAHQGFDLQLTQYDEKGWRATFYTTGMEHSPTSATGTGWERTPWHATDVELNGLLVGEPREARPSIMSGCFVMGLSHASHTCTLARCFERKCAAGLR